MKISIYAPVPKSILKQRVNLNCASELTRIPSQGHLVLFQVVPFSVAASAGKDWSGERGLVGERGFEPPTPLVPNQIPRKSKPIEMWSLQVIAAERLAATVLAFC
jgi:hypothetical protein